MKLGRLEKIDLRKQWKKEDTDFTPWLAEEVNIELLGKVIDMELEVQGQEESVGPFKADIFCVDTRTNNYVLIENQLEKTDHTHLGQLMTYAAGLEAVAIIWIAKEFTEEHRAALDWLNSITDDTFNFFGIEIELFKIGDSNPAPMFNLVAKPNNWARSVKRSASLHSLSDMQLLQLEYWQALKNHLSKEHSKIKMPTPLPQNWLNIGIGKNNFTLSIAVNSRENTINVGLYLIGNNAKNNYDKLKEIAFEKSFEEIDNKVSWLRMEDNKQSAIILTFKRNIKDKNDWETQFAWFKEYLECFDKFFRPLIKKI